MKYTAINIGPVIKTISFARRPRELWAASYLFSYLMKCIVATAKNRACKIIAPIEGKANDLAVGLYPDRLYLRHEGDIDASAIIGEAWEMFNSKVFFNNEVFPKSSVDVRGYFNLMHVSPPLQTDSDSVAIKKLNEYLDMLELCVFANNPWEGKDVTENVLKLICKRKDSPLMTGSQGNNMPMETLAEFAACQLKTVDVDRWREFEEKNHDDKFTDDPYEVFRNLKEYRSYHRYFCVVQADGDNMGKNITSGKLTNEDLKNVSGKLWNYGIDASHVIEEFGGKAIYAGGDDLLFIAPVVGKDGSDIFTLLGRIEDKFKPVVDAVSAPVNEDVPALSFGVAIAYYKHPLYEVLESARKLLFEVAKKGTVKSKVAWTLKKHSGETFTSCYSKLDDGLDAAFKTLIAKTSEGDVVSVAAHKMNTNSTLLEKCLAADRYCPGSPHLDSFFATIIGADDDSYFKAVKELIKKMDTAKDVTNFGSTLYAMLRTAKFIKGEDTKDE